MKEIKEGYMYIYKITNTINNKIYIGQTIKNIENRSGTRINTKKS